MTPSIETLTYRDVARTIDHSLLRPELNDAFVDAGCRLAAAYDVASVCVRPADVVRARAILEGTARPTRTWRSCAGVSRRTCRSRQPAASEPSTRCSRSWPSA